MEMGEVREQEALGPGLDETYGGTERDPCRIPCCCPIKRKEKSEKLRTRM